MGKIIGSFCGPQTNKMDLNDVDSNMWEVEYAESYN
jgi:hypothetical protein